MSSYQSSPNLDLETRRRRVRFRSWHRGTREADLILGPFADHAAAGLTGPELDQYEALLEEADADVLAWLTGGAPVPAAFDTPLLRRIAAHGRGNAD